MAGKVEFDIVGRTAAYEAALVKVGGQTEAAAAKMAKSWQKAELTKIAKDTAGIGVAVDNVGGKWAAVGKQVSSLAGGPFAQLGTAMFELVPKAEAAASSMGGIAAAGGTFAAVAVAAGAIVVGVKKLADAAVAAEERLIKAGRAAEIPPQAHASLLAYTKATEDLSAAADVASVTVGSKFATLLTGGLTLSSMAADALGKGINAITTALGSALPYVEAFALGFAGLGGAIVLGPIVAMPALLYSIGSAAADAAAETERLAAAGRSAADGIAAAIAANNRKAVEGARAAEDLRKKEEAEAERAAQARIDAITRVAQAAADQTVQDLEGVKDAIDDQIAQYQDAAAKRLAIERSTAEEMIRLKREVYAWQEAQDAMAEAAASAAAEKRLQDLENLGQAMTRAIADTASAASDVVAQSAENASKKSKAALEEFKQAHGDRKDYTDAEQRQFERLRDAQKRATRNYAAYAKAAGVAQAIISGAVGVAVAAASAPPPLNIPAIIAATATGAAQVYAARSVDVPSLFSGGRNRGDGEGTATLHRGESVLNSRATDAIVRALNLGLDPIRGLAGSSGGGGDVILDGRRVGRQIAKQARGTGTLGVAVHGNRPVGYRNPYRGG